MFSSSLKAKLLQHAPKRILLGAQQRPKSVFNLPKTLCEATTFHRKPKCFTSQQIRSMFFQETPIEFPKQERVTPAQSRFLKAREKYDELATELHPVNVHERVNELINMVSDSIHLEPMNAEYYYLRAKMHMMIGAYEDAFDDYDRVLKVDPTHVLVMVERADVLVNLGRKQEALEAYTSAIFAYDATAAYLSRGQLQLDMGMKEKARADLKVAEKRLNQLIPVQQHALYCYLGQLALEDDNHKLCIRYMKQAEEIRELPPSYCEVLASAYALTDDLPNALKYIDKVLLTTNLTPETKEAVLIKKVGLCLDMDHYETALKESEAILRYNPDSQFGQFFRAKALYEMDRYPEALQAVNQFLEMMRDRQDDPTVEDALEIREGCIFASVRPKGNQEEDD